MSNGPSLPEVQRYLELLYPDIQDGWLVLSRPDPDPTHVNPKGKRWLRSEWLDLAQTSLARVAEIAALLSAQDTVYFGAEHYGASLERKMREAYREGQE